jgi:hypothetical protein
MLEYTDKLDENMKISSDNNQYTTTTTTTTTTMTKPTNMACNKWPMNFNFKNQECSLPGRSQDVYYAIISNYKNNRERILEFNNKIIKNNKKTNNNKKNDDKNSIQLLKRASIQGRQEESSANEFEYKTIALFLDEEESRFGFSLKGAYDAYSHASIEHIVSGKNHYCCSCNFYFFYFLK